MLRHGERADWVQKSRQPANFHLPYDPPLTDFGVTQAEHSADYILSLCPPGAPLYIVCSPLYRTIMTAAALARKANTTIHLQDGFGEWLYSGDFSESPMDKLLCRQTDLGAELGVRIVNTEAITRATYPESHSKVSARVRYVFPRFIAQVSEPVVVIVTHASLVEFVSELWTGSSCSFSESLFCTLTHAVMRPDGSYEVKVLGSTSHCPQNSRY